MIAILIFLLLFPLYALGVSHSVYGGDSGDLISAAWFGGVAHPPGYPLNTMIGWVFTHLPFEATVAFKANLVAAFFMSLSVGVFYLICFRLTKSIFASLLASLFLAFIPLFWLYAHIFEVFQLNVLLIGITFYFLLTWREKYSIKKKNYKYLYYAAISYGFAVFHHQTALLLGFSGLYLIFKTDRKIFSNKYLLIKLLGCFFFGALPYVFVPFAALRKTPINWDDPVNLHNFIRLVTRADYGTFTAANHIIASSLMQKIDILKDYLLFLRADFSLLGLLLVVIGAVYCFIKERIYFLVILSAVVFIGPFFVFYSAFPIPNDFFAGLWERFILASYFLLAIFIAFAFKFLIEAINIRIGNNLKLRVLRPEALRLLTTLCLFLPIIYFFVVNQPKTDLNKFMLGDWLAHDILVSAEPNAILLLIGDTPTFNTQYYYYTHPEFRHIKLIKAGALGFLDGRIEVVRQYPELSYPDKFLESNPNLDSLGGIDAVVKANLGKFPIYIRDYSPNLPDVQLVQSGLLQKIVSKETEVTADELVALNDQKLANFYYKDFGVSTGYVQFMSTHIKEQYYKSLLYTSNAFLIVKDYKRTEEYANRAISLLPDKKDAYFALGLSLMDEKKCDLARQNLEKAQRIDKKDSNIALGLLNLYSSCIVDETKARQYNDLYLELKRAGENKL